MSAAARIKPLEPPYEQEVETYLNKLMPPRSSLEPLKLFRTLAVNLEIASRMRPLGAGLLAHNTIAPRERELVILRTTALNGADYEWGVHATFFDELTEDEIRSTLPGEAHDWSERDALLIRMCDELNRQQASRTSCGTNSKGTGRTPSSSSSSCSQAGTGRSPT